MAKRTVSLLNSLGFTVEEAQIIVRAGEIHSYPRDTTIAQNLYANETLYFVLEGSVNVVTVESEGQEIVLASYDTGEYFGGFEFGNVPSITSIKSLESSSLLELQMTDLKALLPKASGSTRKIFEGVLDGVEKQGQKLSEAIQQKRAITEILRAISTSPSDLSSLLATVAENAARLCDAEDASIMQVEGDDLKLVAKYGPSQLWPVGEKRRISRDWVTGRAVFDCKPIHILDLQAEKTEFPEGAGYAIKYGHRTTYAVPLIRKGSAIGGILIRRFKVDPVTEQQRELLWAFADQAAIAIENVSLFNEINEKSIMLKEQSEELAQWNEKLEIRVSEQVAQLEQFAKLEHELKLASDIQKSMLPRTIPRFEGYEIYADLVPAKTVGGDFYEFIPLGEDSLAIAIGDVADKGIPAALFMAMVRSFLRAETRPGISPRKVLEAVNSHLLELNDKGIFVTILLGFLNRKTHQFTYTRAGHELPILIDYKGSAKQLYKGEGQALGIFDILTLDEQSISLANNNTMVLYTDGITDAINEKNQMFGQQGILQMVSDLPNQSVGKVCEELFRAVTDYQNPLPQFDDMTIVAIRSEDS